MKSIFSSRTVTSLAMALAMLAQMLQPFSAAPAYADKPVDNGGTTATTTPVVGMLVSVNNPVLPQFNDSNKTKYALMRNQLGSFEIQNATDVTAADIHSGQVTVVFQGDMARTFDGAWDGSKISFSFTPDGTACGNVVVAYIRNGNVTKNDTGTGSAGIKIVNALGNTIPCETTTTGGGGTSAAVGAGLITKVADLNGNGTVDAEDQFAWLDGWTFTATSSLGEQQHFTTAGGTAAFNLNTSATWTVCEDPNQKVGWVQTAPASSGCLTVDTAEGQNLVFANHKLAQISGIKCADYNVNGACDTGENPIEGLKVQLSHGATVVTQYTAPDGTYSFTGLMPGTYTVVEFPPSTQVATAPTTRTVEIGANTYLAGTVTADDHNGQNFCNVCFGTDSRAKSLSYWSTATLTATDWGKLRPALNTLNLKIQGGQDEDYASNQNANRWQNYLKSSTNPAMAPKLAYQLSAQLSVLEANIILGGLDAPVYINGTLYTM